MSSLWANIEICCFFVWVY